MLDISKMYLKEINFLTLKCVQKSAQGHPFHLNLGKYPRDFSIPTAWYEETKADFKIFAKYQGKLFFAKQVNIYSTFK